MQHYKFPQGGEWKRNQEEKEKYYNGRKNGKKRRPENREKGKTVILKLSEKCCSQIQSHK